MRLFGSSKKGRFFDPQHRVSTAGALSDLMSVLRIRHLYQIWFMLAAALVTGLILFAFWKDANMKIPYKRDIIYVENWRADRSIEEIIAQQKIDEPIKQKRIAEEKERREKRRKEFEKIDNALREYGI